MHEVIVPHLFFVALQSSDRVALRIAAQRKREPLVHVNVQGTLGGSPFSSELWLQRDSYLCHFQCKFGLFDYTYVQNASGTVEIERHTLKYDRNKRVRNGTGWGMIGSKVFGACDYVFPMVLLADFSKFDVKAKVSTIPGGDRMTWTGQTQAGPIDYVVDADSTGRIIGYSEKTGRGLRKWAFSYLPAGNAIPGEKLRLAIPDGYFPQSLPRPDSPLEPGSAFPVDGWTDGKSGARVNLKSKLGNRVAIVALLDNGAPSQAAQASLGRIRASGVPVVIIADAGAKPEVGWLRDEKGKNLAKLNALGAPMFFFVNPDGTIKIMMMGFDAKAPQSFEKEAIRNLNSKE